MAMFWATVWAALRRGLAAAADLVLPSRLRRVSRRPPSARCAAPARMPCGRPSRGVGCACRWFATATATATAMPWCWAGARFEGALRLAVTAYKDEGRRDLRDELARLLGVALTAAADEPAVRRRLGLGEEVLVVPVPTARASRRRRGDDPVGALAVAAVAAANGRRSGVGARVRPAAARVGRHGPYGGLVVVPALVHTRRVADQAHLDRAARAQQPRRLDGGGRAVARGGAWRHLRARRRRRHDRRDARRGGPRAARRRCPARRGSRVRHDATPLTGPALVAHRPSD